MKQVIEKKLEKLFLDKAEADEPEKPHESDAVDFFRYAYHYAVENAPNHYPKMQNYVALYGLLRTLSLISLLLFWIVFVHAFTRTLTAWGIVFWVTAVSLLTYVLFMAFQKFYRRFSLEALMALSVTYPPPPSK